MSSYLLAGSEKLLILLYDVSTLNRSAASRVAHLIFGRKDAQRDSRLPYIERPEVMWIGQSVFLLPLSIAEELSERIQCLGAIVTMAHVSIAQREIDVFRRRAHERRTASTR